jgi:hypothetical protein
MLKIGELKPGDIINVNDEGIEREGVVLEISHEENQVLVDNGVQEFWYNPEEMSAITLDEEHLMKLGFEKEGLNGGAVKYKKGAFRLVTFRKGDFSNIELWYREDRRHFNYQIGLHQLQNLHLQMTKVPLEMPA